MVESPIVGNVYILFVPKCEWSEPPFWNSSLDFFCANKSVRVLRYTYGGNIEVSLIGDISHLIVVKDSWLHLSYQLKLDLEYEDADYDDS